MKDEMSLDRLAQMVQRGFDDPKDELKAEIQTLRTEVNNGFTEINRRIDNVVQPQLDDQVRRIKTLEEEVFPH